MKLKNNIEINNSFKFKKNNSKIKIVKLLNDLKKTTAQKNSQLSYFAKGYNPKIDFKKLARYKKFRSLCFVGMGGSILGIKSIHSFLQVKIKKRVYFFDNLDVQKFEKLKNKDMKKTLFIFISKSGNTLETLVNINVLNSYKINNKNIIIISEKNSGVLKKFSDKKRIFFLEHPKEIGGRFSIFSVVGLLPIFLFDLKIQKFLPNLREFLTNYSKILIDSTTFLSKKYLDSKINSIIFLSFNKKLNNLIFWIQQMISESLGKSGKGLLPVLSVAPKDYHSLLQLYLDGPKDKIFYFFDLNDKTKKLTIKNIFDKNVAFINKKKLPDIISAQKKALKVILRRKNIPFRDFKLSNCNEKTLSIIFTFFIIETILIGKSLNINPFNQPAVEQVKILTKKFLKESN